MNWESKYVQDFQEEVETNGLRNPDSIAKFFKSKMDGWKEVHWNHWQFWNREIKFYQHNQGLSLKYIIYFYVFPP